MTNDQTIVKPYTVDTVKRLRGSVRIEHTLARRGAEILRSSLAHERTHDGFINALGALTGNQAIQQVRAGLRAIYLSGWQVAADANLAGDMYPDQSIYPANSVPAVVDKINKALRRADQIERIEGNHSRDWFVPIIADAEAGFGGKSNAFELMKWMIEAGAAAVHFEDQLSSEKKCGHLGGKVLVPTRQFIETLIAARLASDVEDVPSLIIARTDADAARLLTTDVDPADRPFMTGERTVEGFYRIRGGLEQAIQRGCAYAPYADLIWCETSKPDLDDAQAFADGIHAKFPGKWLAYNCSPSFNWRKHLSDEQIRTFQQRLAKMGYVFQFITLAGFHALNFSMFELASEYRDSQMSAYAKLQDREFDAVSRGYTAVKHQREVGTDYFDEVSKAISSGASSTLAMDGSTEKDQF